MAFFPGTTGISWHQKRKPFSLGEKLPPSENIPPCGTLPTQERLPPHETLPLLTTHYSLVPFLLSCICFCFYFIITILLQLLLLHPFNGLFSRDILGKPATERQTILDFTGARDDGVAVASAGPNANHLHHLAPDK